MRDTGIVLEDIAKALQPFGQINSDLNRKYIGTGLGLPLATELAEMHGGTLVLCSEPGVWHHDYGALSLRTHCADDPRGSRPTGIRRLIEIIPCRVLGITSCFSAPATF